MSEWIKERRDRVCVCGRLERSNIMFTIKVVFDVISHRHTHTHSTQCRYGFPFYIILLLVRLLSSSSSRYYIFSIESAYELVFLLNTNLPATDVNCFIRSHMCGSVTEQYFHLCCSENDTWKESTVCWWYNTSSFIWRNYVNLTWNTEWSGLETDTIAIKYWLFILYSLTF